MEAEPSTNEQTAVDAMRDELRRTMVRERKQHRAEAMNRNRAAIGEILEDRFYTPEFVAEKARALKKKSLNPRDYQRLQNALIQSEENINAFLKVDNILFALARDLSGKNPTAQLNAANCCCNVALGNPKACSSLSKSIAPYLVPELESLNRPLVEVCVWTVGNLATGCRNAFEVLRVQDCGKYLVALLNDCEDTLLPSVIYATLHWLRAGFHYTTGPEVLEITRILLRRNVAYENPDYMWLLALLSSSEKVYNEHLRNILQIVASYLREASVNGFPAVAEVTASVRILANTVAGSAELAEGFLDDPEFPLESNLNVLNKLLTHHRSHLRKESLWLTGNLVNASARARERITGSQELLSSVERALTSS